MSLLIQTTVLIMVIALITYSRLDMFIPRKALEHEIVNYMSNVERNWMNRAAWEYYDSLHPIKKNTSSKEGKPEPQPSTNATGYISLRPLFENSSAEVENTKNVLKNLLTVLYAKQPFVINAIDKEGYSDPSTLFSELIDAIILEGKNRPPEDRISSVDQFIQMDLGPLQPIFANIINGCSCTQEEAPAPKAMEDEENEGEGTQDAVPRNYCSLFSFANLQPYKKLSVYLAPEETLMALYGNPQTVEDILQARTQANREYKRNPTPEVQAALERFKAVPAAVDAQFLDFNVTNTDPNRKRKRK